MNVAPQLTAEEFSNIHNAKCELHAVTDALRDVLSEKVCSRLQKAIELLNNGLKTAYKQQDAAFASRSAHYDSISEANGFKTIWSVYDVEDLNVPFADAATHILYEDHWGGQPVTVAINGNTWVDLWRAAEEAIVQSGDTHHIFIEAFIPGKEGVLVLSTGS